MADFIRSAFSGRNDKSIDIGRIIWPVTHFSLIVLHGFAVIANHAAFDPMAFATSHAALMAAGGGSLLLKATTEPKE